MNNPDELTIHVMHGYDTIESPTGDKYFGCYVQGQNEIYIADGIPCDQFFFTLAHEYAHFLQDADGRDFVLMIGKKMIHEYIKIQIANTEIIEIH